MQRIIPYLWFDQNAEEAVEHYTSIFSNATTGKVSRYGKEGFEIHGMKEGTVLTIEFSLKGFDFVALNGGPHFTLNPAISFFILCSSKEEADTYWSKLIEGGKALMPLDAYPFSERYGWLEDRYGVSWQVMYRAEAVPAQKIVPSLLFVGEVVGKAEEAMRFYTQVFAQSPIADGKSAVGEIARYPKEAAPNAEGAVMYGEFTLAGQTFTAMDSGLEHDFGFNEAVSLMILCDTQEEVDYFWEQLSFVPDSEQCGWLKDKFGVSWQVVPKILFELMNDPDPEKAGRVTRAVLDMKKLTIAELIRAHELESSG